MRSLATYSYEVGEDELHPLASLIEINRVLSENYKNEHVPELTAE